MIFTPEQQAAVESFDQHCVVSAGAGSGKTRVLVERFLRILEREGSERNPFSRVLAITFTDKAAAEMKERIRQGIRERAKGEPVMDASAALPWNDWLAQMEGAQVMTFHAFCAALLREFPVEADVDPHFTVADEQEAGEWLDEAVEEALTHTVESGDPPGAEPLLLAWGSAGAVAGLTRLYREMTGNGWDSDELAARTHRAWEEAAAERDRQEHEHRMVFLSAAEQLAELDGGKRLQRFRDAWLEEASFMRDSKEETNPLLRRLKRFLSLLKGNWGRDEILLRYRDQAKESAEMWVNLLRGRSLAPREAEVAAAVCDLLGKVERAYRRRKEERCVLDFDELQVRAIRLLRNHAGVAETIRRRIRWLMVDEFQDTNPVQRELFQLMLPGPAGEELPGKGFVVGDPKQSIYRFRGADVGLFTEVRDEWLAKGGREVQLLDNFRSTHGLVAVVNRLFSDLFPRFSSARPHREGGGEPPVEVWLQPSAAKGEDPLEAEAEAVAARIDTLLQTGTEPGEIAVLFQAMTHVKVFEGALSQRGIPFHVVKGRGFFSRQEVWDWIHAIRLLANPDDPLSWVGVLRSPLCGVSDETLLRLSRKDEWHRHPEQWLEWIDDPAEERFKLSRFLDDWERWCRWTGRIPVSDLLERMVRESEVREVWGTTPRGRQAVANVNKWVRMARQWEKEASFSLSAWLDRLNGVLIRQMEETEAPLTPSEQNRVSLMTIHQSKGLEFPVVFLPEIARKLQYEWGEVRVDRRSGLVLKVPNPSGFWEETDRWIRWREREAKQAREESARLLYVAATRAERKLILSGVPQEHKGTARGESLLSGDTWSKWLDGILGYHRIEWEKGNWTFPDDEEGLFLAVHSFADKEERDPWGKEAEDKRPIFPPIPDPIAPGRWEPRGWTDADRLEVSVTQLNRLANCPRRHFFAEVLEMPEGPGETLRRDGSVSAPIPPRVRGELVHRLLETMIRIPQSDEDWILAARIMLEEWEIHPGRHERALEEFRPLVHAYIRSRYCQEVHTMAHLLREAPFSLEKYGLRVTGTVDRLHCTREGRWELVDWKTNDVGPEEVDELALEYLPQLQLYAMAVREQWGIQLDRASLYFLKPDREVSFPVEADWLAEAEESLISWSRMLRGDQMSQFPAKPGNRCGYCPYIAWCDQAIIEPDQISP
ncbi:UvrD-helicase domain-containing protein [Desmospora profundinema]|uniref:DNA 3'-5' helicase n=1 Tax=Desmospora profundinema TaxID=1571184 RepID=A0ABU1IKC1_9BACL|nr:UvrD-helicase domain-containing protein [Desmospora profundinema]MDR6225229.1 ATP-dependent helicase/nuclease subunit A [Desmospora profundinema]